MAPNEGVPWWSKTSRALVPAASLNFHHNKGLGADSVRPPASNTAERWVQTAEPRRPRRQDLGPAGAGRIGRHAALLVRQVERPPIGDKVLATDPETGKLESEVVDILAPAAPEEVSTVAEQRAYVFRYFKLRDRQDE